MTRRLAQLLKADRRLETCGVRAAVEAAEVAVEGVQASNRQQRHPLLLQIHPGRPLRPGQRLRAPLKG